VCQQEYASVDLLGLFMCLCVGVFNPCGHEMSENLKRKIVKFDKTSLQGHSCEDKWFNKEENNVLKKKIV